ncbi:MULTISPECIES: LexA family protein [Prosthecochloris]|uniref:Translesion error-prone DNA polymerase V autoproteolytic subunit n=1 Tax=Prosthecochloris vibrioformis TaxID=1098 RepID=A0A5C4S0M0_PROVB|nr:MULTISPECIES: translesion error-prone DNA polymerase V autoproteolytic subunit [Prosthecochloris]ANT64963.1 LexA repressor [Prosthecochloris sp. CIB 2401]TNJ36964.1 translesion error-prone DNA polymerase V autoproteolytic subunit [Prosthecochloris vibrioformis]
MRFSFLARGVNLDFYSADTSSECPLPFAESEVVAGFPSPADDHLDISLDLNQALIRHPAATFYARVKGSSMIDAGIEEGDLLVVDKALEPKDGDIAVCFLDGEFTVKRISLREGEVCLVAANRDFPEIRVSGESDLVIWGVVTYVIHRAR